MQNGMVSPKSPHYQTGGVVDILKQAMGQYGQPVEEGMYTPQGGRTKLGYAQEYGLTPESVGIDTLSFQNPANYMFKITGETPRGTTISDISEATGALPLKEDVNKAIASYYGDDLYGQQDARTDLFRKLKAVGQPSAEVRKKAEASKEKQMMMKALGMSEKEYDDFQAMKAMLGKRNYQQGGEVGVGLEDLIGKITEKRPDLPPEGMQDIMSKIAFHESGGTGDIGLKQYGGGPGRGVYQFERGAAQGGATAGNRLANQLEVYGMEVPKWLKSFNKSGKGDVSGLSRDKQDMLFLGNMLQHPQANMGEVISGDMGLAEFWQQYHQAGGADVKDARIAAFAESMGGYSPDRRRGGPVYGYQQGGQVLPRKQQEMRSPDSGSADMDSLLKQIMMRGVNQSTGDSTASTVLDSMKMQQGGMVGGTPLMQDMSQDKRVKPLQPDRYVVTGGKMTKQEMEVPKLSRAYLASFGMETPLSKRQRSVLNRRAIAPETLSPQVKGLIGRILVQRLTNEPE